MRKKWLATLLSLAMVLSLLPTWAIATGEETPVTQADAIAAGAKVYVYSNNGPVGDTDLLPETYNTDALRRNSAYRGYFANINNAMKCTLWSGYTFELLDDVEVTGNDSYFSLLKTYENQGNYPNYTAETDVLYGPGALYCLKQGGGIEHIYFDLNGHTLTLGKDENGNPLYFAIGSGCMINLHFVNGTVTTDWGNSVPDGTAMFKVFSGRYNGYTSSSTNFILSLDTATITTSQGTVIDVQENEYAKDSWGNVLKIFCKGNDNFIKVSGAAKSAINLYGNTSNQNPRKDPGLYIGATSSDYVYDSGTLNIIGEYDDAAARAGTAAINARGEVVRLNENSNSLVIDGFDYCLSDCLAVDEPSAGFGIKLSAATNVFKPYQYAQGKGPVDPLRSGLFSHDVSDYVKNGYECVENDDPDTMTKYPFKVQVTPDYVARLYHTDGSSKGYMTVQDAVDAAGDGDAIMLLPKSGSILENVTFGPETLTGAKKRVELCLARTMEAQDIGVPAITVRNMDLTIISATNDWGGYYVISYDSSALVIGENANVTLESGTIAARTETTGSTDAVVLQGEGAHLTVAGGEIVAPDGVPVVVNAGTCEVQEGATFDCSPNGNIFSLGSGVSKDAVEIRGGTFYRTNQYSANGTPGTLDELIPADLTALGAELVAIQIQKTDPASGGWYYIDEYTVSIPEARIEGGASYLTLQDAVDHAQDGDTIVLVKDVVDENGVSVEFRSEEQRSITLDLNGHTVTLNYEGYNTQQAITNMGSAVFLVKGAGMELTIKDSVGGGGVKNERRGYGIVVMGRAKLEIFDGTYTTNDATPVLLMDNREGDGSEIIIHDGTFYGGYYNVVQIEDSPNSQDYESRLIVYGGYFSSWRPASECNIFGISYEVPLQVYGGHFDRLTSNKGYSGESLRDFAPDEDINWTVHEDGEAPYTYYITSDKMTPENVAAIGDEKYSSLDSAFAAAKSGDTVTLLKDVTIPADTTMTIPAGVTLVFEDDNTKLTNNGTLNIAGTLALGGGDFMANGHYNLHNAGTLNLKSGGTLKSKSGDMDMVQLGTLTIEAGAWHYLHENETAAFGPEDNSAWTVMKSGKVTQGLIGVTPADGYLYVFDADDETPADVTLNYQLWNYDKYELTNGTYKLVYVEEFNGTLGDSAVTDTSPKLIVGTGATLVFDENSVLKTLSEADMTKFEVAEGLNGHIEQTQDQESGKYVYTFVEVKPACVAKIGDVEYGTLQAALNDAAAADSTQIVTLLSNVSENVSFSMSATRNVKLDLDGYVLTGNVTVSAPENSTAVFTVLNPIAKNGKIVGDITVTNGKLTISGSSTQKVTVEGSIFLTNVADASIQGIVKQTNAEKAAITVNGEKSLLKITNTAVIDAAGTAIAADGGTAKVLSDSSTSAAKVTGTITKAEGATVAITGGVFSEQPSNDCLATDYEATQDGDFWKVAKTQVKVDVPTDFEVGEGLTEQAEDIVEQLTNNDAVNDVNTKLDTAAPATSIKEHKSAVYDALTDEQKEQVGDISSEVSFTTSTYVKVTPQKAELADDEESTKLTFDVKPMLKVTVDEQTVETELLPSMVGEGDRFATPVTFRLPLTDDFDEYAKVTHYSTDGTIAVEVFRPQVQDGNGDDAGGKYVEIQADRFCPFEVSPDNDPPIVKVNGHEYADYEFLQAVRAAEAGNYTMYLLADVGFEEVYDEASGDRIPLDLKANVKVDRRKAEGETYGFSVELAADEEYCFVFVGEEATTGVTASVALANAPEDDAPYKLEDEIKVNVCLKQDDEVVTNYVAAYVEVQFNTDYVTVSGTPERDGWEVKDATNGIYVFYDTTGGNGDLGTFTLTAKNTTPTAGATIAEIKAAQYVDSVEDAYTGVMVAVQLGDAATARIIGELHWVDADDQKIDAPVYTDSTVYTAQGWNGGSTAKALTADGQAATITAAYFDKDGDALTDTRVGTNGEPINAGTYQVQFTATYDGYEALTSGKLPFTITAAPLSIDQITPIADDITGQAGVQVVFDGTAKTLVEETGVSASGKLDADSDVNYAYTFEIKEGSDDDYESGNTATQKGDYTVKCTVSAGANYASASGEVGVSIVYPEHKVIVTPYIDGYSVVYVFIKNPYTAHIKYRGEYVYDITKLGYTFNGDTLERSNGPTSGYNVFAYLVEDPGNLLTAGDAENNIEFIKQNNKKLAGSLSLRSDPCDVDNRTGVSLTDAVVVVTTHNKNSEIMAKLSSNMTKILRADVDGNGIVEIISTSGKTVGDALLIKKAVTGLVYDEP